MKMVFNRIALYTELDFIYINKWNNLIRYCQLMKQKPSISYLHGQCKIASCKH